MGFFDVLKSTIASRTSWTLPQSAAVPVGRRTTLLTRSSTFALRSMSTSPRTVGGPCSSEPNRPPGSISSRLPVTRTTRVEFPATRGSRPMSRAVTTRPAAEMRTATTRRTMTSQTPRLAATGSLPGRMRTDECSSIAPGPDGPRRGVFTLGIRPETAGNRPRNAISASDVRLVIGADRSNGRKPYVFSRLADGAPFAER
jgi:hypothetical protein